MDEHKWVVEINSTVEFDRLLNDSPDFRKLRDEGAGIVRLFPYILQDIFFALFNDYPKLLPLSIVSTGVRLNRLIIEQLMKSREFKRIRSFSRQNPRGAGIIALYFGELVIRGLDSGIIETANEISVSEDELRDALLWEKVAEKIVCIAAKENRQDAVKVYEASAGQWHRVAEEKRKELRSLAARLNMQWNTSGRKNIAGTGAGEVGEKEGRFETGVEGLGDNKGVWARGDLTPHLELVETYLNSPKLKKLIQKVGRLKEIRERSRDRKMVEDTTEVRGIDYGNDLTMVVPEEWAEYFQPRKRTGFKKKYSDEALCLYDMKGRRRRGKGSMIICLDNSGSMQGPKEETSKAIAIALMEIAITQRRDFVIIMFGGPEDEMKVFEVPQGRCTLAQLVEIGEHFLCSPGTDFEKPLQEAMRYLDKDKYPGGDIIFITDGVCSVSPEFLERYRAQKKARQFRTIGVMVNYGQVPTVPVQAFCDELMISKDLKGLDVAGRLFSQMRAR